MIGVEGQYVLAFSVGGATDFLKETDLISFKLEEQAGNILPRFVMGFRLSDEKLRKFFNQGNVVNLQIGKDKRHLKDTSLRILNKNETELGHGEWNIFIIGVFDALDYIKNPKSYITKEISGVEAIKEIGQNHFKINSTLEKSNDKMKWIQPYISDCRFINEIWMHSYLPDSFIGVAITSLGDLIIRDMKEEATHTRHVFYPQVPMHTDLPGVSAYNGEYKKSDNSGIMNSMFGYKTKRYVNILETGELTNYETEHRAILSNSGKFNRKAGLKGNVHSWQQQTENMHENYWKAYDQNISYLALFSSLSVQLSVWHKYLDLNVLDCVYFHDVQEGRVGGQSYTGYYYISRMVRQVDHKMFRTNFTLSRESRGELIGSLE